MRPHIYLFQHLGGLESTTHSWSLWAPVILKGGYTNIRAVGWFPIHDIMRNITHV